VGCLGSFRLVGLLVWAMILMLTQRIIEIALVATPYCAFLRLGLALAPVATYFIPFINEDLTSQG
jgi:hypothetical protein